MKVEENVPLASLTTFRVGGPVRYLITLDTKEDAVRAVAFAHEKGLPLIPFGGGSNILAPDELLEAVMVRVGMRDMVFEGSRVRVGAGASWDAVVQEATARTLWGIENLSAIPGMVGGAVVQNIGAYGSALSETLCAVDAYDTQEGRCVTFHARECAFGYRTSIFKQSPDRYIILEVTVGLRADGVPNVSYADLAVYKNIFSTSKDVRDKVIEIRAAKFPPLASCGTAGSFFLNPVLTAHEAHEVQVRYPNMPVFVLPEGGIKIPLGWYFEHVLGIRGYRDGNVEAWRAQALVLTAHAGATATEIKNFAKKICERAHTELKITLIPEVRIL